MIGRLALIFAGILLGLAVTESALRLLGLGEQGFYQWDPYRGWALRPGAAGWQHREGDAFVEVNRDGTDLQIRFDALARRFIYRRRASSFARRLCLSG